MPPDDEERHHVESRTAPMPGRKPYPYGLDVKEWSPVRVNDNNPWKTGVIDDPGSSDVLSCRRRPSFKCALLISSQEWEICHEPEESAKWNLGNDIPIVSLPAFKQTSLAWRSDPLHPLPVAEKASAPTFPDAVTFSAPWRQRMLIQTPFSAICSIRCSETRPIFRNTRRFAKCSGKKGSSVS